MVFVTIKSSATSYAYTPAVIEPAELYYFNPIVEDNFGIANLGEYLTFPEVTTCLAVTVVYENAQMVGIHIPIGIFQTGTSADADLRREFAMNKLKATLFYAAQLPANPIFSLVGSSSPSSSSSSSSSSPPASSSSQESVPKVSEVYFCGAFSKWRENNPNWMSEMCFLIGNYFELPKGEPYLYQWPQTIDGGNAFYRVRIPGALSDSLWTWQRSSKKLPALKPGDWKRINPKNMGFSEWRDDQSYK